MCRDESNEEVRCERRVTKGHKALTDIGNLVLRWTPANPRQTRPGELPEDAATSRRQAMIH